MNDIDAGERLLSLAASNDWKHAQELLEACPLAFLRNTGSDTVMRYLDRISWDKLLSLVCRSLHRVLHVPLCGRCYLSSWQSGIEQSLHEHPFLFFSCVPFSRPSFSYGRYSHSKVAYLFDYTAIAERIHPFDTESWRFGVDEFVHVEYWDSFYRGLNPSSLIDSQISTSTTHGNYEWYSGYTYIRESLQRILSEKQTLEDFCGNVLHVGSGTSNLGHLLQKESWFSGYVVNLDASFPALLISSSIRSCESLTHHLIKENVSYDLLNSYDRQLDVDAKRFSLSSTSACHIDAVQSFYETCAFRGGVFDLCIDKGGLDALWTSYGAEHPVIREAISSFHRLLTTNGEYILFSCTSTELVSDSFAKHPECQWTILEECRLRGRSNDDSGHLLPFSLYRIRRE